MGQRVQRKQTYIPQNEMKNSISRSWKRLFGYDPSSDQVAMIMAQNALETGHRKSMYNYNVGNITTDGKVHNYFDDLKTKEQMSPGKWEEKYLKYRAYNSLDEGVIDYLNFLSKNKRYQKAWQHIENPNPEKYSKELKRAGYYTANEPQYTAGIKNLFRQYSGSKLDQKQDSVLPIAAPKKQQPSQGMNVMKYLEDLLGKYLQEVKASESYNGRLYKNFLPEQYFVIEAKSNNSIDSIEFSRILCSALDEELLALANIHVKDDCVEVECRISGPKEDCFNTIKQLTDSVSSAFCDATKKIGSIKINTNIINKRSSYPYISITNSELNYNKFINKFAGENNAT